MQSSTIKQIELIVLIVLLVGITIGLVMKKNQFSEENNFDFRLYANNSNSSNGSNYTNFSTITMKVGQQCNPASCPRTLDSNFGKSFVCPNHQYQAKFYPRSRTLEFRDIEPFGIGESYHMVSSWNRSRSDNATFYSKLGTNNFYRDDIWMVMTSCVNQQKYPQIETLCQGSDNSNMTTARMVVTKVKNLFSDNRTFYNDCSFTMDKIGWNTQ